MPKRKKKKEDDKLIETELVDEPAVEVEESAETKPQTEETTEEAPPQEEVSIEKPEPTKKQKGIVKVKVLVGTLQFEDGSYEKGDIFEVSKPRAMLFDPKDIEILK